MKCGIVSALVPLLALVGVAADAEEKPRSLLQGQKAPTPVHKVVQLLQDLKKKLVAEGKAEEELWEAWLCWANKVVNEKTASNDKAESRIDHLTKYIEDIKAGRMEFSSERVDLENELKVLEESIKMAKAGRKKDEGEFTAASAELKAAIEALTKALKVIQSVTDKTLKPQEELLATRAELSETFGERVEDGMLLRKAIDLGKHSLSAADAFFLVRLFSGEAVAKAPKDAVFKMKYKARSRNIIGILNKMRTTFQNNLDEATAKEEEDARNFENLIKSKTEQRDLLKTSLREMVGEGASRAEVIEQSKAEIRFLEEQIDNDTKTINETKKAIEEKTKEFKDRSEARAKEVEAVGKAISILYSDDARDLFKSSFSSHKGGVGGVDFFQVGSVSSTTEAQRKASEVLRATARDGRVRGLALRISLALGGHFEDVIKAIDEMIEKLKEEGQEDEDIVDECKKDLHDDTSESAKITHTIDGLNDQILALIDEIKSLETEIKEKHEMIAEIEESVKQATLDRKLEHAQWKKTDADDSAAMILVEQAQKVLKDMYGFVQVGKRFNRKQMQQVKAGEAPPPPPPTWEGGYEKKEEEGGDIVVMLGLIIDSIEQDLDWAEDAEKKAKKEFEEFKKESEAQIKELDEAITDCKDKVSAAELKKGDLEKEKGSEQEDLDTIVKRMREVEPHCSFYFDNIDMRRKNRQTEIDGLFNAKSILKGAAEF